MEGSKTVLLVGTLDTKGAEYAYLRDRLKLHGVDTILANGPSEAVEALYGGRELQRLTEHTLTTLGALEDDFARIRRRGYALDNEEHEEGVGCVAVAVFDHSGRASAAISVSGPSARILAANAARLGALLVDHAAKVSDALGFEAAA